MSEKSVPQAEQMGASEVFQSPALPAMGDGRDDGAAVARLAHEQMSAFVRGERVPSAVPVRRRVGQRVPWGGLGVGVLLLASLSACLERLAWMGQH